MFTIYQIINSLNNDSYVGFTTKPSPNKRWVEHKSAAKHFHDGFHLHRAMRKYGSENFKFLILEEGWCPKIGLQVREPYWISLLKPEYNMTSGGEGNLGYKHSEETKKKLKKPKSFLTRQKMSEASQGISKSASHRMNMSYAQKRKPPVTLETRQKQSISAKNRKKMVR